MKLQALATATPDFKITQGQCLELAQRPAVRERISRRSAWLLQAVLSGDCGVSTRYFALPDAENAFTLSAGQLNEAFRMEAPKLACKALDQALQKSGIRAQDLDALLVCTCTGYLCPGVSSYVAERMALRSDAILHDLVGLGCGAAIPMLRTAGMLLAAHPDATVACVAVEVCSAAFYLDDDPGVLISACLFGDGAAASIWRSQGAAGQLRVHNFTTLHRPEHRDKIRFENREGKLRNLLHADLPGLAAEAVGELFGKEQTRGKPLTRVVAHGGGRDVVNAVEQRLPGFPLDATRAILRHYGNMSSPSVLFALEEALRTGRPDSESDWWLVSFGAGFSVHGCRLGLE